MSITGIAMDVSTNLTDFNGVLDQMLHKVESTDSFEAYENALAEGATQLSEAIQRIGRESADYLAALPKKSTQDARMPASIISYLWMEEAKKYLILWRNVLLQQQKGKIMELDEQVRKEALLELGNQSKAVLRKAGEELKTYFPKEHNRLKTSDVGRKQLKKWSFQNNPWAVYEEQINQLVTQCREAEVQQNGLQNTTLGFKSIHQLVKETIQSCQNELQQLRTLATNTIHYINENIEEKPGMVGPRLEDLEEEVKLPNHLKTFSASLKEKVDDLAAKMRVPIDTNSGMVQFKEANFKKNAQSWLDSEVVPVLYEIWEITESAEQSMKMSLVNIRNRAILLSNEKKEGKEKPIEKEYYGQPLEALIKKVDEWSTEIDQLEQTIQERLDKEFRLSAIYDAEKTFLPVSLQLSLIHISEPTRPY